MFEVQSDGLLGSSQSKGSRSLPGRGIRGTVPALTCLAPVQARSLPLGLSLPIWPHTCQFRLPRSHRNRQTHQLLRVLHTVPESPRFGCQQVGWLVGKATSSLWILPPSLPLILFCSFITCGCVHRPIQSRGPEGAYSLWVTLLPGL